MGIQLSPLIEKDAVVCLQEVSMLWASDLHVWFHNRGYHFICSLYGSKFSNYMGVALAYPYKKYEAMEIDIARLSDTKGVWMHEMRKDKKEKPKSVLDPILSPISAVLGWSINKISSLGHLFLSSSDNATNTRDEVDEFEYSRNRQNRIITATLRPLDGSQALTVSTYHMPCAFWSPKVMLIHSALAVQHAQRVANGRPLALVGDWNFKPHEPQYKLITSLTLPNPEDTPSYPDLDSWRLDTSLKPMNSAYAAANGKEPDFTNFAQIRDEPVFCETLDYIFLSQDIKVSSVKQLPPRGSIPGPLPTKDEPSDHLLLWAEIEVKTS